MQIILFILTTYGLSYIISNEYITSPIRKYIKKKNDWLGHLISCLYCTSFWVGLISGIFLLSGIYIYLGGFIGYTSVKIIQTILDYLGDFKPNYDE